MVDWQDFLDVTCGREPREWLTKALALIPAGSQRPNPMRAIDLGCGAGNDTLALLEHGFAVTVIDITPSAVHLTRERARNAGYDDEIRPAIGSFGAVRLSPGSWHLVHAGFSLPFAEPDEFTEVWDDLRRGLAPGGFLVAQLFGDRDEWAAPGRDVAKLFHRREEVERLLGGFEAVEIEEVERDGQTADGTPKHWHVYHLLLRRDPSRA